MTASAWCARAGTATAVAVVAVVAAQLLYEPCPDVAGLRGAHVLITGASSGIGEQLAKEYAAAGAIVTVAARRKERLDSVANECIRLGATAAHAIRADMGKPDDASSLPTRAVEAAGRPIDVLVLNHAVIPESMTLDYGSEEDIARAVSAPMRINYEGSVRAAVASLPSLLSTAGRVVVVSSGTAKTPAYFLGGYSASKAALHGFFDTFRAELRATGRGNVSVSLLVLGMIGTDEVLSAPELQSMAMPVSQCAKAMVCAERAREDEAFLPRYLWAFVRLNAFVPGVTDWVMRAMFVNRVPEFVKRIAELRASA